MLLKDFCKIINDDKPVIVMFYTNWCNLSFELIPIFLDYACKEIEFIHIDIDKYLDIRDYCNINSTCIIQVYYKNIMIREHLFSSLENLREIISNCLNLIEKRKRIIYDKPIVIGDTIIYKTNKKITYNF